jgi:hypothetical protein
VKAAGLSSSLGGGDCSNALSSLALISTGFFTDSILAPSHIIMVFTININYYFLLTSTLFLPGKSLGRFFDQS